jgi:hypothetical protein
MIVVWNFSRRAAKEGSSRVIAQVKLPGAAKVKYAGKREHARYGGFKCSETNSKVPAGGVAGDTNPLEVKFDERVIFMRMQSTIDAADILKGSGPASAGIAHATILNVPGGDTDFFQRSAKMSRINKVVLSPPITAVYEEDHGVRAFAFRQAHVNKLVRVLAVRETQIGCGRLFAEDVFTLHASSIKQA